jgi:Ca-activated chloride channel family protein
LTPLHDNQKVWQVAADPAQPRTGHLEASTGFFLTDTNSVSDEASPRDAATERAAMAANAREAVRQYLKSFERLPGERPRDMFFRFFGDNPAVSAIEDALSTFAIDVDSASYTLARASLFRGILPSRYAIRTEEFVNYFPGETPPPQAGGAVFSIVSDAAPSPFGNEAGQVLLRIVVKGREVAKVDRKPLALTFVVDVSGSMQQDGRLDLVKRSLHLLVGELDERDTVALVKFADTAARVLPPTSGADADKETILAAIDALGIESGTNTFAGLVAGYESAAESPRENAMNRVILCSDGVANVGETAVEKMLEAVREQKERGIYVNTIGVGMGNLNDALLEQFANEGDGICNYVDDLAEARRVFVTQLTGTLETIAKDVKIQVAFDPNGVAAWRQLGYENRAVADEDFRNDAVDGGEVGAGHEVVALYEITPRPGFDARSLAFGKVSVRWKDPANGAVSEVEEKLAGRGAASFDATPRSFRLHAMAAEFAEILRESVWARGSQLVALGKRLEEVVEAHERRADVVELAALVKQASLLAAKSTSDDAERRLADDLAQNALLRAKLADSRKPQDAARIAELEKQAKEIEEKLGNRLMKRLTGDESATLSEADVERLRGLGYIGDDERKITESLGYIAPRKKDR